NGPRSTNWTDQDTYLAHAYFTLFKNEGQYKVSWTLTWQSYDVDAFEKKFDTSKMISNMTTWATYFTTQSSAPTVDVVATTASNGKTCPEDYGVVPNVTDETMNVPWNVRWSGRDYTNNTCAVVANSTPTLTSSPIRSILTTPLSQAWRPLTQPDYAVV
ncbi:hypothetical protein PENANT_c094G05076, partial [Penicillium antarcticum]